MAKVFVRKSLKMDSRDLLKKTHVTGQTDLQVHRTFDCLGSLSKPSVRPAVNRFVPTVLPSVYLMIVPQGRPSVRLPLTDLSLVLCPSVSLSLWI